MIQNPWETFQDLFTVPPAPVLGAVKEEDRSLNGDEDEGCLERVSSW